MKQKIESGLQLLSRVTHRPDLQGLNSTIFSQGPHPGEIIEITGEEGTGKTLLATDLLARCLLLKSYKEIQLPGKECGALFVNTNHHFDVFKLAEILQHYIKSSCTTLKSNTTVQEIIKASLKNLFVINCYTNEQFQATLLNLESLILKEVNISLLIVDSVAAFYWIERIHKTLSFNAYYVSIINTLKNLASKFCITVVYTKPTVAKESTKKHVDVKIHLRKKEENVFEMEVVNNCLVQHNVCIRYKIEKTFRFEK